MAAEWVKARRDLPRDPKVIAIADHLALDRASIDRLILPDGQPSIQTAYDRVTRCVTVSVTVTGLLQVWGIGREQGRQEGDDLVIDCIGLEMLDEIAGVPGLGRAMATVGWAAERP